MEYVCDDDGSQWHYEGKAYFRDPADGQHSGHVKGEYLPDPTLLWETRLKQLSAVRAMEGRELSEFDRRSVRPSDATFALWNHWQGVSDAE